MALASLLTMMAACSDASTSVPTTAPVLITTIETVNTTEAVAATDIVGGRATVVHASVDDASLTGFTIGPTDADVAVMEMERRLGPASADSGWVPVAESFHCHLYAESRTVWWGDIALSFGRAPVVVSPGYENSDYLEGWSVGVVDTFRTVPLLGGPVAPLVEVVLDGTLEVGSSDADLARLVDESGYRYFDGFLHGRSYFLLAVNVEAGAVAGFGVNPIECYDDTSGV